MKQLRILTGLHAGAQLTLKRRLYQIASSEDADIQISDWFHAPLILVLDDKGSDVLLALHLRGDDGQPAQAQGMLEDFVPRCFGDVVLCAGPEEAAWPSDMSLMAKLMNPAPADAGKRSSRGKGRSISLTVCALVSIGVLVTAFIGVVATQPATATVSPNQPRDRVQLALRTAGVEGLTVRQVDRRVVVEGLLAESADMARVRAALQPFGEDLLMHRYTTASDLARQIGDALNAPGLRIVYKGSGVFAIEGQSADPARLREDARRVAADIGPLVSRLDVAVTEALAPGRVPVGAMLHGESLQYVQTADGTKHLSLQDPPEEDDGVVIEPGAAQPSSTSSTPRRN